MKMQGMLEKQEKQRKLEHMRAEDNYQLETRGLRILHKALSSYVGQVFVSAYGDSWWDEVLKDLHWERNLPSDGEYGELVDSLDLPNCLKLMSIKWGDLFKYKIGSNRLCLGYVKELKNDRDLFAHHGPEDVAQPEVERALNTMILLCEEINPDAAEELREVYMVVRERAADITPAEKILAEMLAQPASLSKRGELKEGSLLLKVGTDLVQRTNAKRKVTFGGKTEEYPVYKVRLDALYYNDQNDRIATWISRYEAENGVDSLMDLNPEIYNRVIEGFIYESNPEAINRTQNNIKAFMQREPAVTLADGRVVDGNRRFTCLRRMQRETPEPLYLETVIIDMDMEADKKQIKLLELAIQHGEEAKVDYDLIDYAVGTYRDVMQTGLLTIDEYAESANEPPAEVRKRIEIAGMLSEFLSFIRLPEQYHVAREYKVYSLMQEMMAPMRKLDEEEKRQLKNIAFSNAVMQAIPDQRKFIRDIKGLVKSETYKSYFEKLQPVIDTIIDLLANTEICSKDDLDDFAKAHPEITEELQQAMEEALLKSRMGQVKDRPAQNVSKCITLLSGLDQRLLSTMDSEKENEFRAGLDELEKVIAELRTSIG